MDELALRALKVASCVALHGSFRAAARELELSPSSVSHTIAGLEARLGIRLFLRNTRSVSLTEAGETFLQRVRPALEQIDQAIEGVNEMRDHPSGLIRLNASAWGAERLLPIILDFMSHYPQVRVELFTEGRLVDIIADGFDAGMRLLPVVPQDMIALPLGIEAALIIVAAPGYLQRHDTPATPADLLQHECIRARLPSGAMMRWEFSQRGVESEVDVSGRLVVGNTLLAAQAAVAGIGLACVEQHDAAPMLQAGTLVQVLADWTPPFEGDALYYPRMRLPSAAFRAFVDHVRAYTRHKL